MVTPLLPIAEEGIATLAAADALEARGRIADAIGLLTAANRVEPDPAFESALVALRHRGFGALDRPEPLDVPPAVTADPGTPGPIHPLTPQELDLGSLRAGLAQHGCVIVRGLVSPDRAAGLARGIDAALDGFDRGAGGAPLAETAPWYEPFSPEAGAYRLGGRRNWVRASGAVWTADSPRMLFELTELIDQTGIGSLVEEYLGERPALSANKCTLRRVPIDTNTQWHQDGAFLGGDVRTLNLWLALADCGVDAPGLDIVPRRFDRVLEPGTGTAMFDWAVADEAVAEAAGDVQVVRPQFGPGDAMLFDHLFLHRTAVGPAMTHERHAIETWFFAPSGYPEGQIPIVY